MNFNTVKFNLMFFVCLCLFTHTVMAQEKFDCVGVEPSWRLSISNDKISFLHGSDTALIMKPVKPSSAENMSLEHIKIYRTTLNNKEAIIILQKQSCTDGTSEEVFQYEGLFITHDKVFHGCCSQKIMLTH